MIIILAAAIIISLNNNNPIMEANKARYDSDVANMQAVFTNAVAKVMAKNQATLTVSAGQINTITGGVKEIEGEVAYTLTDAQNVNNSTGKIVFDKKANTDTTFYTGKKLPIYAAGETKWYVDDEGNIYLEVAGKKYGNSDLVKGGESGNESEEDPNAVTYAIFSEDDMSLRFYKNSDLPVIGDKYNDLTVSAIYNDNFEATNYFYYFNWTTYEDDWELPGWSWAGDSNYEKIEKVVFEDKISPTSTSYWFAELTNENLTIDLSKLDTSKVIDMNHMFANCTNINSLNISNFNTANVEDMSYMFTYCSNLTSLELSNFDTVNVENMYDMFRECSKLVSLNISNFNTSKVTNMVAMFKGCTSLTTLTLFSTFNTSNVTEMNHMFEECSSLTSLILPDTFNTDNVIHISRMFNGCINLILDCSNWNVDNITDYEYFNENAPGVISPTWKN